MEQTVEGSKKQIKNPSRTGTGTGTDFEDLTSSTETVTESQELDKLLVDYLESMEVYVRTTLDEENLLREGFINISHARLCMKPYLISLYGFPSDSTPEINASATTTTSPVNETETVASSITDVDLNQDSNHNPSRNSHPHLHRVLNMETSKDKTSQLRKIFGQTTPESLKKAQSDFHRVLERSVERANIMNRLKYLEGRILQITSLSMRAPTPTTTTTTTSQQLQPQQQQQQQLQNQNKDSHQSTGTGTGTGKPNPPQLSKSSSKKSNNKQERSENEKENSDSSDILKIEKLSMSEEDF